MPIVADAAVKVGADLSKFKQDLAGAGKQTDSLGKKMSAALNPKNLAGGFAVAFAGSQVVQLIEGATNAAAEFQDSVSATGVIFGEEAIPAMEEWAETAHESFGASKQDALAAANQFAVFGKSAGLAGDELVDFSTEMVQLGGDLASFFGGTTEDAITAVGAALRGESEPIRRYGVLLDDATLRQRAFEMGLISTTDNALTPQQRVLAAHAEILAQTSDAQGDFVRTSDGMANQQRALAAELENLNIELGEKLMPVMIEFVTWVSDTGVPALKEFIDLLDFTNENSADGIPVLEQTEDALNGIAEGLLKTGDNIRGQMGAVLEWGEVSHKTYSDARKDVQDYAEAHNVSWGEATDALIEGQEAQEDALEESNAALARGVDAVDGWEAGMTDAANRASENFDAATDEIVTDAGQTPGEMARSLLDGLHAWEDSWRLMEEAATSEMDKGRRIRNNLARLASVELIQGLRSQDTARRAAAEQVRDDLIRALQIDGYNYGYNLAYTYAQGMKAGRGILVGTAMNLGTAIRRQLAINSEPEDPNSPLHGITKWGGNIVKTIASGIYSELGTGAGAARALAGSLVPAVAATAAPIGGAAYSAGVSRGGDTYQVYVNKLREPPTLKEIGGELQRLGEMGKLPRVTR